MAMNDALLEEQQLTLHNSLSGWQTVVWDDPVNLMSYVARIFRTYFGYSSERAHDLMMRVHNDGHAVVAEGAKETMEAHVHAMHNYGLSATVRKAPDA